ncbi:MAG: hypothetical protein ACLU98_08465 [Desulfovibrio fairfieldensis]
MGVISDIADQTNLLALNAAMRPPARASRARFRRGGRRSAQAGGKPWPPPMAWATPSRPSGKYGQEHGRRGQCRGTHQQPWLAGQSVRPWKKSSPPLKPRRTRSMPLPRPARAVRRQRGNQQSIVRSTTCPARPPRPWPDRQAVSIWRGARA